MDQFIFFWLLELQNSKENKGNAPFFFDFCSKTPDHCDAVTPKKRGLCSVACSKNMKILDPLSCLFCQDLHKIVVRYVLQKVKMSTH